MSIVRTDKKIPAGILAILVGGFGVHKFFLGYSRAGVTMLGADLLGLLLVRIGFLGLGWIGSLMLFGVHLTAFIEGVIYLTRSDTDFYRQYVAGRRPWF